MDVTELDPWVGEWMASNPLPELESSPEFLAAARGSWDVPVTREIAHVRDDVLAGVPVRVYAHDGPATGVVVYFHGGGWCVGSVALMDNVARELAHATGATVISVEYRLAPEHPYPAGFDDCLAVTGAALSSSDVPVLVAGESAGGNLAAAVALRLRDEPGQSPALAGQVLIYPAVDAHGSPHASRAQYYGLVVSEKASEWYWASYTGGRSELDEDPYVAPLHAPSLAGLPPALLVLGGCDFLRDEGHAYAEALRAAGVPTEEHCAPGQPHGFVNFAFPAATEAWDVIGRWARARLAA